MSPLWCADIGSGCDYREVARDKYTTSDTQYVGRSGAGIDPRGACNGGILGSVARSKKVNV